ncbi:MAG: cation transporter [Bacillota bacterium]|nr:cation transporter [Bacillota bacterium]
MNADSAGSGYESTLVLHIEGMSCNHCRIAVQRALLQVPGVRTAEVDLASGTAKVTFDPTRANRLEMEKAVEGEGYRVSS